MSNGSVRAKKVEKEDANWSAAALAELQVLGIHSTGRLRRTRIDGIDPVGGRPLVPKRAISAPEVLNEAYDYDNPSSFSRGLRIELGEATMLLLSGTASIGEDGETVYAGDFEAQCLRTFRNLTRLLAAEKASWHDVVRTSCYLRDIERDYDAFNKMRTMFLTAIGVDPLPASTGIQARLCRSDLLIEIEATAMIPSENAAG